MALVICNHAFKGPFYGTGQVEDRPGVFVLLERRGRGYRVLEAGYCRSLRSGLAERRAGEALLWAVFYDHNLPHGQREELMDGLTGLNAEYRILNAEFSR